MRTIKIILIALSAIIIAACNSSKKTTKTTAASTPALATTPVVTTTVTPKISYMVTASPNASRPPGNEELTAIQAKYNDVTMEKLKEGHELYTTGACVNCHNSKDIYKREEYRWKDIMDDMAKKANISDTQKDLIYKYVLSIKATQPK